MPLRKLLLLILPVILLAPLVHADPPAAEFRSGHWVPIAAPATQPAPPDADLAHMKQLLDAGDATAAMHVGLYWIKTHDKHAPHRDEAIYLLAEGNYQIDDRIKSFYYLDELMDEYPTSPLYYPALEKQYHIADGFLNGHKLKLLGLPILSADEEAIQMLYRIQMRSPGSPLAEKSLLRTADFYYASGDYELAHDAYGYYIKNYSRSPEVPQVKLRQAFSSLAQFRGIRFDPTCIIDARTELKDIVAGYPELAREQNLPALIDRINTALAAKAYVTADYYRRTHAYGGAVYMYRYLIATYPNAQDVPAAKKRLNSMPKWALQQAPPQVDAQYPTGAKAGA
jgi:outer membrane assembly lipoprotein YfiO